jgi:hypothetical protein
MDEEILEKKICVAHESVGDRHSDFAAFVDTVSSG